MPDPGTEVGREIYNNHCYFCHGYAGDAKTLATGYLDPKPRDFTALKLTDRSRADMIRTVSNGRAGSAMMAFADRLSPEQIGAVVHFVRTAFMAGKDSNMRYHSPENGWFDHERRNHLAYSFVLGETPIDRPWSELSAVERKGRRLFMSTCITCHDRPRADRPGPLWDGSAVSFPRGGYSHRSQGTGRRVDATSSATPYALHDRRPQVAHLSASERRGETLFQANCAFCHAADGTGKGWIGSFLKRHPRNLTDLEAMGHLNRAGLRRAIRDGLPGTTMSAWSKVLKPTEIDDLVAYIIRVFYMPTEGE